MIKHTIDMTVPIWPGLDKRQQLAIRKMDSREMMERMTAVQVMRAMGEPGRMMRVRLAQIERQRALVAKQKATLKAAKKAKEEALNALA